MELLPNSKCLTKIKNHLQLGLIRELIGLLPVGKQWGAYIANGSVAYPIPFTSAVYRIIAFGGENRGYQTNAEFNLSNLKQVENAYNYPGQYIAVGK